MTENLNAQEDYQCIIRSRALVTLTVIVDATRRLNYVSTISLYLKVYTGCKLKRQETKSKVYFPFRQASQGDPITSKGVFDSREYVRRGGGRYGVRYMNGNYRIITLCCPW